MFDKDKFIAMLLNHKVKKQDLANYLDIKLYSLNRKIREGGSFNMEEVRLMINLFGKDEVIDCLFSCEQRCHNARKRGLNDDY